MPIEPFEPPEDEYEDIPGRQAELALDNPKLDGRNADTTPDAADPRGQQRIRQKKKFQVQQSADFWQRVFSDPVGRRVMWEMLESMHTFETRFACTPAGFPCAEATWFQAGEHETGQRLYHTFMRHDFEGCALMLREYHPDFVQRQPKRTTPAPE